MTDPNRYDEYREAVHTLDQASRQHAATKGETLDWQAGRARAIVDLSSLGVPRSTVARLAGITRGRVQQILEDAGEAGITGDAWADPDLRRLVESAIANRPVPSAGVGIRRESASGPHIGEGFGVAVRLTGDLEKDRDSIVASIERLLAQVKAGQLDDLLTLTDEELDLVRGNLIDDKDQTP
jgi:hypothetical protein